MRIAVLIITLVLMLVVGVQSCAVAAGSSLVEDEKNSGAGAIGVLVALLYLVAAAFVLAKPRVSFIVFIVAGALALLGAASSDFSDLYVWAVVSAALAAMSYFGLRAKRREEAATAPAVDDRPTKTCPDCAETVLADAKVCRHCGYRFQPDQPEAVAQ